MYAQGQFIAQLMEKLAPKKYAVQGDPIGLQVGSLQKEVRQILITLDVTDKVVDEAAAIGADLIIAHHPVVFMPMKHIRTDLPQGRLLEKCIKHNIAVYAAHTNLDVAQGGVNDLLCEALGVQGEGYLDETYREPLLKLVVYAPEEAKEQVRQALFQAGAGSIGAYSRCSFNSEGIGTFLPGEHSNPTIGEQGKLEHVREVKIETIVPAADAKAAVRAVEKAHPYEEPAYDLFPLELKGTSCGLGRVAKLSRTIPLSELAQHVKQRLNMGHIRVIGDMNRTIKKIAVLGGSGRKYVRKAQFAGADVLITGDIDYHTALDAKSDGMCIIDAGHAIEKVMKQGLLNYMSQQLQQSRYETGVVASEIDTDPFQFV